jgi:uncharacterized protein YbjT (DUF2867 family)
MKVLVLGGNGFIGSNIAEAIKMAGAEVIIGGRKARNSSQIAVQMHTMKNAENWLNVLNGFDVVVNSVGILRERKNESYTQLHANAVQSLAQACAAMNIRLIHISALGLSMQAKSRFIQSKFEGEQMILASGAQANIVRAPLLDGEGGFGAKWFRRVASWPLQFVMQSEGLVAPLQVVDLAEAVANLVMDANNMPTIIELGGNDVLSIPDYLQLLRARRGELRALQITVPRVLVRVASHLFDVLNWTPLSFGHFELMQGCNVPAKNLLPDLLSHEPTLVGESTTILVRGVGIKPIYSGIKQKMI